MCAFKEARSKALSHHFFQNSLCFLYLKISKAFPKGPLRKGIASIFTALSLNSIPAIRRNGNVWLSLSTAGGSYFNRIPAIMKDRTEHHNYFI